MMDQAGRRRQVLLAWAFIQRSRGENVPTNDDLAQIAMARAVPPRLRTPLINRWAHVLHHLMWLSDQGHPDPVRDAMRIAPAGPPPQNRPPQNGPPQSRMPRSGFPTQNLPSQHVRPPAPRPGFPTENLPPQPVAPLPSGQSAPPAASAVHSPSDPPGELFTLSDRVPPTVAEVNQEIADPLQRLMVWRDRMGHEELKDRHLRQIVNSGARDVTEVGAGLPASLKPLAGSIADVLGLQTPAHPPRRPGDPGGPTVGPPAAGPVGSPGQSRIAGDPESSAPGPMDHPSPTSHPPGQPSSVGPSSTPPPSAAAPPTSRDPGPAGPPGDPSRLNPHAITWEQPLQLAEERTRFAALDFSRPTGDPVPIRAAARADGSVFLRWPIPVDPQPATVYRIVSDDEHVPFSPDMSEVIAITSQSTLIDSRSFASAVRHYQVWVNEGPLWEDALIDQPRLHARISVVAKPVAVDIREDEGRVIGQWTLLGDVRRVQIFRVPEARASSGAANPVYRICADEPNLGGFVDDGAEAGQRYLYQLLVEAEVEGVPQLSLPTVVPIVTAAVLDPVGDLACALGDETEQPRFDLAWTSPRAGRVVIYRTTEGPVAGADAATVEESALPQMRLRPEDRLAHPMVADGTMTRMRDVPWPRGWSRTYFTPVTLLGGRARVGRTTSQVRTGTVEDARVVERVTQQVLTMDWPDGAAAIKVYASPHGQSAAEAIDGAEPIAEISEDTYVRLGGLHFARPLDVNGCDLHLLPISFAGGHAVFGKSTTVRYKGLFRLWYSAEVRRGLMGRGPVQLVVRVKGDRDYPHSPPFALVLNEQRLPLDVNDGDPLQVQAADQTWWHRFNAVPLTRSWSEPGWVANVTGRTGWVRLFIDLPPDPNRGTVALLDPPVAHLNVSGR